VAESSIGRARRLAKEKREKREAEEAAAAKAAEPKESKPEKKESSLLASIRRAFSSADDISRIDAAVDAVSGGVKKADEDANTDHKRKK